jgi:hypothetical protein
VTSCPALGIERPVVITAAVAVALLGGHRRALLAPWPAVGSLLGRLALLGGHPGSRARCSADRSRPAVPGRALADGQGLFRGSTSSRFPFPVPGAAGSTWPRCSTITAWRCSAAGRDHRGRVPLVLLADGAGPDAGRTAGAVRVP